MRQLLKTLLIAAGLWLITSPAYAGIPIPCTGETIVKVLDIDSVPGRNPGIPGLIERPVDLGYKFSGCGNGRWVGYTGQSGRYLDLPEPVLKLLLLKAGRTEFPPAPSFMGTLSASWVVWMYIVLFIPVIIAGIFGKKPEAALTTAQDGPISPPARAQAPLGPMATAARVRAPNIQSRLGGQPGFGRRA